MCVYIHVYVCVCVFVSQSCVVDLLAIIEFSCQESAGKPTSSLVAL